MNCVKCGQPIPERRLSVLPNTRVCRDCSTEQPVHGFRVFDNKSTSHLVVVRPEDKETLRQARNAYSGIRWKGKHNWDHKPI